MRIGVYINTLELYYSIKGKYGRDTSIIPKLNFQAYYDWIKDLGDIIDCIAYGTTDVDESGNAKAAKFISMLSQTGYFPKFKYIYPGDDTIKKLFRWDVGMATDILTMAPKLDCVVLGTNNRCFDYLLNDLNNRKVKTLVFGCLIPAELKKASPCIEIPESCLESFNPNRQAMSNLLTSDVIGNDSDGSEAVSIT